VNEPSKSLFSLLSSDVALVSLDSFGGSHHFGLSHILIFSS
jgi:hypothetical protein